jgi:ATP-dependent Lon protease
VLGHALTSPLVPIDWTEADDLAAVPPPELAAAPDEVSIRH